MTRYFTALIVYMIVFSIVGIMFDGFDSKSSTTITVIIASSATFGVYLLYPIFTHHDK